MGCCFSRSEKHFYPCLLVGRVLHGKPVSDFNRRIITLWVETGSVEEGSLAAVEAGKGKVQVLESLGRVTVGVEDQVSVIHRWAEKAMKDDDGRSVSEDVIFERIKEEMVANEPPNGDVTVVELDIFRGYVINRMKYLVFVARKPNSFP